jgi:hypothetical protein
VKVTEVVALPAKLYDAGKVMMIVEVALDAPLGVVKRITCEDVALIESDDIVSERPVRDAASAGCIGNTVTTVRIKTRRKLIGFVRV